MGACLSQWGDLGGSFSLSLSGIDSYTTDWAGNDSLGTYFRETVGGGSWTRTGSDAGSGINGYTLSLDGDERAGHFNASHVGSDRYSLLEHFNDISNTDPGITTPGNVSFHSHGLPFRDPIGSVLSAVLGLAPNTVGQGKPAYIKYDIATEKFVIVFPSGRQSRFDTKGQAEAFLESIREDTGDEIQRQIVRPLEQGLSKPVPKQVVPPRDISDAMGGKTYDELKKEDPAAAEVIRNQWEMNFSIAPPALGPTKGSSFDAMSPIDRLMRAVSYAILESATDEIKNALIKFNQTLLDPAVQSMLIAMSGAYIAGKVLGYGWAVDAIAASLLYAIGGQQAFIASVHVVKFLMISLTAESETDLRLAGRELAKGMVKLAEAGLLVWGARGFQKKLNEPLPFGGNSSKADAVAGAPIPRGPKPVTGTKPGSYLDEAVAQQGLSKPPAGGLKQKWSEGGFDYEVRVHPADPAHGKTGSIYRVARRSQAKDANNQGAGWEYMDSTGKWHPESTLKPGKPGHPNPTYNDAAARDTHIQLPPDVPPP